MRQEDIVILVLPILQHLQHSLFGRSGRALELSGLNSLPGDFKVGFELDIDEASLAQLICIFLGW